MGDEEEEGRSEGHQTGVDGLEKGDPPCLIDQIKECVTIPVEIDEPGVKHDEGEKLLIQDLLILDRPLSGFQMVLEIVEFDRKIFELHRRSPVSLVI